MGNYSIRLTNEIATPSINFINELAKDKNINFTDLFTSAPDVLKDLHYLFTKEKELGATFDKSQHLLSRSVIEKHVLKRSMDAEENAYYFYTLNFLSKVNVEEIIGFSPMDKALNVIMFATKLHETEEEEEEGKYDGTGTTVATPTAVSPAKLAKAIEHFSEPTEKENEGNSELSTSLTSCVREFLNDLTPEILSIYGAKNKLAMPVDLKILKDIKIKSYLESKLGMEETKDAKVKEDSSSKKKQHMNITSISDLSKVNKSAMVMPDFNAKLVKKELMVSKKVSPVTKKQMFVMLLDDSGSMCCQKKQSHVRAVLLNRLEPVTKGNAVLEFHYYESQRYGKRIISTVPEAKAIFEEVCKRRPNGGGTHIGRILQETINESAAAAGFRNPEIMIVCDGDDHVDGAKLDFKGVKVNVIVLGRSNQGLKDAATLSGGWYTEEAMY